MELSSIGPADLDPFVPTSGPPPSEAPADSPDTREPAPLPEGSGTMVDTSA